MKQTAAAQEEQEKLLGAKDRIDWRPFLELLERGLVQPLAGRVILLPDLVPATSGALVIPDAARRLGLNATLHSAKVLAVTPRAEDFPEGFSAGDRVLFLLRKSDLNEPVLITHITRICAVLEPPLYESSL